MWMLRSVTSKENQSSMLFHLFLQRKCPCLLTLTPPFEVDFHSREKTCSISRFFFRVSIVIIRQMFLQIILRLTWFLLRLKVKISCLDFYKVFHGQCKIANSQTANRQIQFFVNRVHYSFKNNLIPSGRNTSTYTLIILFIRFFSGLFVIIEGFLEEVIFKKNQI